VDDESLDRFIEAWGGMGALWGINRSMARVHALLIASADPVGLDELATRLGISRGNASMCLKELRAWGVVKRVHQAGDRRDYYVTEPDVWAMFFRIARERKRREFDPAREAVRSTLDGLDVQTPGDVRARIEQMADLLDTAERVLERALADPRTSRALLAFVAGMPGGPS